MRLFSPQQQIVVECLDFYRQVHIDAAAVPPPVCKSPLGDLVLLLRNASSANTGHFEPFIFEGD